MKIFRVIGESGNVVFQERVPDTTPIIFMQWPKAIEAKIIKLEVVEKKLEVE